MVELQRRAFEHKGLTLSFLDSDSGKPLIALHAHWMEAATFAPLAAALIPEWRLIALDQRGHGFSSHAPTYSRSDYLGDVSALFEHLAIPSAVLLGNSLGGVNAYQFTAHHPERVSALIIEDIGAKIEDDALRLRGPVSIRRAPHSKHRLVRGLCRLSHRRFVKQHTAGS